MTHAPSRRRSAHLRVLALFLALPLGLASCDGSRPPAESPTAEPPPSGASATEGPQVEASAPGGGGASAADAALVALPTTFRTADGLEFVAVLDAPAPERRNGWGVLMIGGGLGNDLDWTVPGSIVVEGQTMQMSISGQTHADAPVIGAALAERGFVIMRWSTIARSDPLADQWPVRATPRSLGDLLQQSRDALGALRATGLVEPDRIILLGHSLGAARACTIAAEDDGVRALTLLAPAYFTRGDRESAAFVDAGMRYGAEVVRMRSVPALAIFGGLDTSRVVDAGAAQALNGTPGFERFAARTMPGLGHQLGPESEGRHGPIDAAVVGMVADWAAGVASER